ncbi:hypothetical protein F4808DRAFT_222232 [Astrocystis sublimbata]|nr:hypothetical protein F4808DRAFT_222232 [Astrocystis sublimbata]
MPSIIAAEFLMATSPSSRKRRRDDNGDVQMSLSSTLEASCHQNRFNSNERLAKPSSWGSASPLGSVAPRKVIALPVSKKFRLLEDPDACGNGHGQLHGHYLHQNDFPPSTPEQSQQSHFSHAHPTHNLAVRPATATKPSSSSSALLSPCHICHRKPTKKTDLDSFGDCTGCGERTCFVCLRECQGWIPTALAGDDRQPWGKMDQITPQAEATEEDLSASFTMHDVDDEENAHGDYEKTSTAQKSQQQENQKTSIGSKAGKNGHWSRSSRGHRSVICSQCCVEQGSEGDVVCLGCLAGMEGT